MHPVLVRNITHLTDARYFAAMNVDWMSIALSIDPVSFSLWHTLKDWVSGVRLAAEINTEDEMFLAKTIIEAAPDGIITSSHVNQEIPSGIQQFIVSTVPGHDQALIKNSIIFSAVADPVLFMDQILKIPPEKIFVQSAWTIDSLRALLETGYRGGICFLGGEEDKTGLKDYQAMDEMLEILAQ